MQLYRIKKEYNIREHICRIGKSKTTFAKVSNVDIRVLNKAIWGLTVSRLSADKIASHLNVNVYEIFEPIFDDDKLTRGNNESE